MSSGNIFQTNFQTFRISILLHLILFYLLILLLLYNSPACIICYATKSRYGSIRNFNQVFIEFFPYPPQNVNERILSGITQFRNFLSTFKMMFGMIYLHFSSALIFFQWVVHLTSHYDRYHLPPKGQSCPLVAGVF